MEPIAPRILVGIPQDLNDHDRLMLHRLNTVMVDEEDYLVETVPEGLSSRTSPNPKRRRLQITQALPGSPEYIIHHNPSRPPQRSVVTKIARDKPPVTHLIEINETPGKTGVPTWFPRAARPTPGVTGELGFCNTGGVVTFLILNLRQRKRVGRPRKPATKTRLGQFLPKPHVFPIPTTI